MRSTNINFKRGILFFVYNATCWLENVQRSTHVFCIWNLFSNCFLFCSWVVFGNCYYLRWLARGRGRAREKKREEWEAMDSGIAFLGWGGSKDQDFCWCSIDLRKGGDTTDLSNNDTTESLLRELWDSYWITNLSISQFRKLEFLVFQVALNMHPRCGTE